MGNKQIEILAPAGELNILKTAVIAGADSVYFGGKALNARRNAGNFTREEIIEGVKFCHLRGRKAFLTLNTILFDEEIKDAVNEISFAAQAGIDAIIVQDMAMFKLIKEICPDMAIHASTQLSAHNVSDCVALQKLGAKRIVVARELSKKEIERIIAACSAEIEVFVHGALCMSVSGQCYFSSALGERSGNRGLCAQVCRLPFYVNNPERHNLSLKDLSLIDEVNELKNMGVTSLKIEGRMKSAAYVDAVVKSIKNALNKEDYDRKYLKDVFSRSGFTKGYYENKLGRDMFGIRDTEDKKATLATAVRAETNKETPCVGIEIYFEAKIGNPVHLTLTDGQNTVSLQGDICQTANMKSVTKADFIAQLSKLGNTVYYPEKIDGIVDENLFLSVSSINELRRKACEQLDHIRENSRIVSYNTSNIKINYPKRKSNKREPLKYARFLKAHQITEKILEQIDFAYLALFEFEKLDDSFIAKYRDKLGAEIPRVYFEDEENIINALKKIKSMGINNAMCHTIGKVMLAKNEGFEILGGFGLNTSNTLALKELRDLDVKQSVLSSEINFKRIAAIGDIMPIGIIAYGYFPVMITRNCPVKIEAGCQKQNCRLTDRKGKQFPVICYEQTTEILNPEPIYYADKQNMLKNLDFILFLFTIESQAQCIEAIEDYRSGRSREVVTRGCYMRDIL